jgi:hypothetical protein
MIQRLVADLSERTANDGTCFMPIFDPSRIAARRDAGKLRSGMTVDMDGARLSYVELNAISMTLELYWGDCMRTTILLSIALFAGCAGTTVKPAGTPDQDRTANGIRYYEAAPFLLVYTDGKGGAVSQLKFLPDVTTKRSIDPFAVLAQNETTLTFTNGVLSQSKTVVDETVVPKSIISALEKVATAAMSAAAADAPGGFRQADLPLPRLYKIVISGNDISLEGGESYTVGGRKLATIRAVITTPGKAAPAGAEDKGGAEGKNGETAASSGNAK